MAKRCLVAGCADGVPPEAKYDLCPTHVKRFSGARSYHKKANGRVLTAAEWAQTAAGVESDEPAAPVERYPDAPETSSQPPESASLESRLVDHVLDSTDWRQVPLELKRRIVELVLEG